MSLLDIGAADTEMLEESFELGTGVVVVEEVVFRDDPTINNVVGRGGVGRRGRSGDDGKLESHH